jgi:hypothetical protein
MNAFEINTIEEGGILRFSLKGPGTTVRVLRAVVAIIIETQSRPFLARTMARGPISPRFACLDDSAARCDSAALGHI